MTSRTADGTRIAALLTPVVAALGYDLERVSVAAVGRRAVIRVVIDRDGGVSLDDVAEISQATSAALDEAEQDGSFGSAPYLLEVTSPGVERPLTEPRHWRRAVGRLVRVRLGVAAVEGRILSADDAGVALEVAGVSRAVPYSELGEGTVQVEFGRRGGEDS